MSNSTLSAAVRAMIPWLCIVLLSGGMPARAQQEDEDDGLVAGADATNVTAALDDVDALDSDTVTVEIRRGRATLNGNVTTLRASEQIAAAIRQLDGVFHVENNIRIYAGDRRDLDMRTEIERALVSNPETSLFKIKVEVKRARARLSGVVNSRQEARAAERIVKSVPGVASFANALVIEPE